MCGVESCRARTLRRLSRVGMVARAERSVLPRPSVLAGPSGSTASGRAGRSCVLAGPSGSAASDVGARGRGACQGLEEVVVVAVVGGGDVFEGEEAVDGAARSGRSK
jgi:hypothetical protein